MDERPIGIFDSGIGGLTVAREVRRRLPNESVIYFGDTARLPYGNKSGETVTRFSREITRFLLARDVKAIVVACNTASALALETLHRETPVEVLGVISPGAKAAVDATATGAIGVIGTHATIRSGAYRSALQALSPEATVVEVATPLFVHLVEENWLDGDVPHRIAGHYLARFDSESVDTIILGCTHYPLLHDLVQSVVGRSVTLVDSAMETAKALEVSLRERGRLSKGSNAGTFTFFASDAPAEVRELSERFLGEPVEVVHAVEQADVPWYER